MLPLPICDHSTVAGLVRAQWSKLQDSECSMVKRSRRVLIFFNHSYSLWSFLSGSEDLLKAWPRLGFCCRWSSPSWRSKGSELWTPNNQSLLTYPHFEKDSNYLWISFLWVIHESFSKRGRFQNLPVVVVLSEVSGRSCMTYRRWYLAQCYCLLCSIYLLAVHHYLLPTKWAHSDVVSLSFKGLAGTGRFFSSSELNDHGWA